MDSKTNVRLIALAVVVAFVIIGGVSFWQTQNVTERSQTVEVGKTFQGSGFSFTYPQEFTADNQGLWTAEGYQRHITPPEACSTCQIPEIEVKATAASHNTIDQQIISEHGLPGTTLAEMSERTGVNYKRLKIGDNDFIKVTVSNLYDVTGYYTMHNDQVIAFKVYWIEKDNRTLEEIISTLKFQ